MKPIILIAFLIASCEPDNSLHDAIKTGFDKVATSAYQLGLTDATNEILRMEISGETIDVTIAKRRAIEKCKRNCPWGSWNESK